MRGEANCYEIALKKNQPTLRVKKPSWKEMLISRCKKKKKIQIWELKRHVFKEVEDNRAS